MPNKVLFFDIDGTILTEECTVPSSAVQAIHTAQANGNLCIINTGRPYSHIEPIVTAIGFDGYLCSCGQHFLLDGKTIFRASLPATVCHEIVALTRQCRLDVAFEAEEGIWFDHTRPIRREVQVSLDRFAQRGFDVDQSIDAPGFQFDKFCVWVNPDSDLPPFLSYIRQYCSVIDREGDLLEMVKLGYSKETGIRAAIQRLGVPLDDCFAIGDSTNDLPMFQCVPHSIAMGNAPDEVKQQAEYVTTPIRQDGVANALKHYHLI
jgi:hypothetical protein